MAKNIVVLGGGYAGVLTAKDLAKIIKKEKLGNDVKVTLIDKNPFHTMLTELHEVAANRVNETSIKMDLKKIFTGRAVNVVLDEIKEMDFDGNKLKGKGKTYDYDYLVVATGSRQAYFGIEGAKENSFPLWSYDDAIRLRTHIKDIFRKAEGETDPEMRKQLLTFFVVGGGFTGVEMVGELAEWMPELLKEFHIEPSEVSINCVDMLKRILTAIPEKLAATAQKRLEKLGVKVSIDTAVKAVGADFITLASASNAAQPPTTVKTSTVIWTAGIEGSDAVQGANIQKSARGGRVQTNEFLQSTERENVYVVGDNIFYTLPGEKAPVPQMVENAEASSKLVAHNIIADIRGKKAEKKAYAPSFHGMMVCIGGRKGVAYVGLPGHFFSISWSLLALISKHFINLIYFLQVLGWNKIFHYLKHEILQVKHNRSLTGGYFANFSPNFWSVPLRMFLGFKWLISGLAKLPQIIADPSHIFLFTLPGTSSTAASAASTVADAVSSASEAVAATPVPDVVSSASGTVADAASTAVSAVASTAPHLPGFLQSLANVFEPGVYGPALPVPHWIQSIVNAVMGTGVFRAIAPGFQAGITILEIIFGCMLIIGLFTALVSVASSLLCVMIWSSGMVDQSMIWYFMAGIALIGIGGTGMTFSTDYYVLPWLKKHWKNVKWVKRLYLYND